MEEYITNLKPLKVFVIKQIMKLKKEQLEFINSLKMERSFDDLLTVNEVLNEYQISRSTFDRWRVNGLRVYQKSKNSVIRVKRKDLINYLNNK